MDIESLTEGVCNSLTSDNKADRLSALKLLRNFCESHENDTDAVVQVYEKCYLHILKCYSDKFESCRELACLVIDEFIKKLPKNDYYMHYITSTIATRIGQTELIEESEEMRLLLVCQLTHLIDKFGDLQASPDPFLKPYNEIIDVLRMRLLDSYPAVQKEACICLKEFASKSSSFHYRAESLSTPLFSVIHHRHFQNRVAAIEALGVVALHITTNADCITKIIGEISPLLMDSMPIVRKECGKFACKLLLELRDRYSFFEKLSPLVLSCLDDDTLENRQEIEVLWRKCGQQYYEENEAELNKLELVDDTPTNYPKGVQRPTLGCRAIVQRCLRVVKIIMRETSDWKPEVRLHALKLLWQFALHTEVTLTPKFMEILPDLARACKDTEFIVARKAMEVGNLLGHLLVYEDWFPHAIEMLERYPNLGYLKCFYSIYLTTKENNSKDIKMLAELLSKPDFTHNLGEDFQMHLIKLATVLWERKTNKDESLETQIERINLADDDRMEEHLYIIAVKVIALSSEDGEASEMSKALLKQMSNGGEKDLHGNYLTSVLRTLDLDIEMDDSCELIAMLEGIICFCGLRSNAMEEYKICIQSVWKRGTSEAKVRILSAISISMLSWNKTITISGEEKLKLLQSFVNDIIVEHLIWKAGYTAESMRSLATATLCAMSEGAADAQPVLLENLKYFPNLLEDNSVSTRIYALRTLYNLKRLTFNIYKDTVNIVLPRLDDPSSEVRKWAAIVLGKLQMDDPENKHKNERRKLMEQILSTLRLYLDSPEPKLKEVIEDSMRPIENQLQEFERVSEDE